MTLAETFIARSRYYLREEYRKKLALAVNAIPAERLWWRPDDASNSAGNLLLHLAGNVRQWIVAGVGGAPDARDRAAEFEARSGLPANELVLRLYATLDEVDAVLATLDETRLAERVTIQGRDVTVLEAVFHVVEHFSLHLGQLILMAKQFSPGAIKFYEDAGGLAKPVWKELQF